MKKSVFVALIVALASAVVLSVDVETARAVPPFKKEFDSLYVKKDSSDPKEKALAEAVEKVKCNVCHIGKDKKKRNDYGQALAKLLTKKDKDPAKIKEAIEKVAAEHSKADDSGSPTFGDLIKDGKLPGGDSE